MKISGFTFIHNALHAGYPIVEACRAVDPYVDEMVVVDMESNDGTRELLERMGVTILEGYWEPGTAGECLQENHYLYKQCKGDIIVHFEADEVFDDGLIDTCIEEIRTADLCHLNVYRLQVEQNFQRIRWYPELVHRVFPRSAEVIKRGHTTNLHNIAVTIPPEFGFLWDVTNCFRDQWVDRIDQQNILHGTGINYLAVPIHASQDNKVGNVSPFLAQEHWTWKTTPLDIPAILRPLVGQTRYEPNV